MNSAVLQRFIKLMAVATFVMFTFWMGYQYLVSGVPGDYEVREGDILLSQQKYDEALDRFAAALKKAPNHRGALMGSAIAYLQSGRHAEAEAEFSHLITYLQRNLGEDDATGWAVLAGAYANRGILYDRTGRYQKALADYVQAIKVDEEAVSGPGIVDNILLYSIEPSTVRKRAIYLQQQLALPEDQRVLRIPELDAEQRMHKP